jgi:hypothetical protein
MRKRDEKRENSKSTKRLNPWMRLAGLAKNLQRKSGDRYAVPSPDAFTVSGYD